MIANFGVGCNDKKTKITPYFFTINFIFSRTLKDEDETLINAKDLEFVEFEDILSKKIDATCLIGKCLNG